MFLPYFLFIYFYFNIFVTTKIVESQNAYLTNRREIKSQHKQRGIKTAVHAQEKVLVEIERGIKIQHKQEKKTSVRTQEIKLVEIESEENK